MIIEPAQKFKSLSEAVVLAALIDPDPENPISREVRRLTDAYAEKFQREIEKLGYVRPQVLDAQARWPIEAVAMRLARDAFTGPAKDASAI